jgi:hypothetical protein
MSLFAGSAAWSGRTSESETFLSFPRVAPAWAKHTGATLPATVPTSAKAVVTSPLAEDHAEGNGDRRGNRAAGLRLRH